MPRAGWPTLVPYPGLAPFSYWTASGVGGVLRFCPRQGRASRAGYEPLPSEGQLSRADGSGVSATSQTCPCARVCRLPNAMVKFCALARAASLRTQLPPESVMPRSTVGNHAKSARSRRASEQRCAAVRCLIILVNRWRSHAHRLDSWIHHGCTVGCATLAPSRQK